MQQRDSQPDAPSFAERWPSPGPLIELGGAGAFMRGYCPSVLKNPPFYKFDFNGICR